MGGGGGGGALVGHSVGAKCDDNNTILCLVL